MKAFILIWGTIQSLGFVCSESCVQAQDYVCNQIPTGYPPGLSSLVFFVKKMGEINSTIFNFTNLSSVSSLTMTQSGITAIAPGAFGQLRNLKTLNLRNNHLSQITSDWFIHKDVLESLILTNNSITALTENSFAGLVGLLNLNLAQNQIHVITTDSFRFLIRLMHLDLSRNKLRHLSVYAFMPVNNTKIHLHENPWDCSCSVYEFALYLRELQKVSLLQNKMEVLCESPDHQRGRPVWNMSRCLNPVTDVALTAASTQTLIPGSSSLPTVISLVVLFHRKQQQKHRLTIQPFPKVEESPRQAQPDCSATAENSKRLDSFNNNKQQSNNRLLLRLDQTSMESQIYQIYSAGMYRRRETTGRAKSAEPVLSRTEGPERRPHTEVEDPSVWMVTDQTVTTGWTEQDIKKFASKAEMKRKDGEYGKKEEAGETELEKHEHIERQDNDFINTLKTEVKDEKNLKEGDNDEHTVEKNVNDQGFSHQDFVPSNCEYDHDDDDDQCHLKSITAMSQSSQEDNDGVQPLEDVENMPYLTIGSNPEKQSPAREQICTKASARQLNLRPIRRTLSWPPNAAQWKKQWAQTQQALSVSPKLIFATQYEYRVGMFPSGLTLDIPENIPQASCTVSPEQIKDHVCVHSVESSMETSEFFNRSRAQDSSSLTRDCVKVALNDGQSEMVRSHLPINNTAHPDMLNVNPICQGINITAAMKTKIKSSQREKTIQSSTGTKTRGKTGRQPIRTQQERKALRTGQRNQSQPDSPAHPSGGSPSDDTLLVDNEYTFIDLLHEVVENNGRWTRDRWRQSHINKQKMKQVSKS